MIQAKLLAAALFTLFLVATVPALAQDRNATGDRAGNPADEALSLEFLEFLGKWETSDGEWMDPEILLDLPGAPGEPPPILSEGDDNAS